MVSYCEISNLRSEIGKPFQALTGPRLIPSHDLVPNDIVTTLQQATSEFTRVAAANHHTIELSPGLDSFWLSNCKRKNRRRYSRNGIGWHWCNKCFPACGKNGGHPHSVTRRTKRRRRCSLCKTATVRC